MKSIYIASPLGFSESGKLFLYQKLIPTVKELGFEVLDPWKLTEQALIDQAQACEEGIAQRLAWGKLNRIIGANNQKAIEKAEIILGILDGADVDSGTASEIGFAAALGKLIVGYRNDFRFSADNAGAVVNLQVEFFIRQSGGTIVKSLEELKATLELISSRA